MAASAISDNPQDREAATFAAPEPAIHVSRTRSSRPHAHRSRYRAEIANVPDVQRCDGPPERVIRGKDAVVAVPVLPRQRHEIRGPVEELKRRQLDDAVGLRTLASTENPLCSQASMSAAAAASSRRRSLNHRITRRRTRSVTVARSVWAMWRPLQDGHTPRPLHENATTNPVPQPVQTTRAKPKQRMPHSG
jgi:hypothetical protein